MGEIKSALELALERTKDVKSDKSQITKQKAEEEGKKTAAGFLSDLPSEKISSEKLKELLKIKKNEELEYFKKGFAALLLSNLKLPDEEINRELLTKLTEGFTVLSGKKKEIAYIFNQTEAFFNQYIQNKNDLTENLKNQFASKLQEKEAALKEQFGEDVKINPENDPEFQEYRHKTVAQLDEQYNQAFVQVREELLKFC